MQSKENFRQDTAEDQFKNCNTFDKSFGKLSAISHVSKKNQNKSQGDHPVGNNFHDNSITDLMNEELMMEF